MSPDGVRTVQHSWTALHRQRESMLLALTRCFDDQPAIGFDPGARAEWLFDAVAALVGLLAWPSRLEHCAGRVGSSWPAAGGHPTFAVEGRAWMAAAAECHPAWTPDIETAWRQAWLLLSDVLASETLSPFSDGCC
jgi:hypothetical protein